MHSIKYLVLALLSISSLDLIKALPAKADIFDILRGSTTCENECLHKLEEARGKLSSKLYRYSYIDHNAQYRATFTCGSQPTVAQSRCLQEIVDKVEKKEVEVQTKAGLMAAQGKIHGRINPDEAEQISLLEAQIGNEISRLVEEARSAALKSNPTANVNRIYSPAGNNSLATGKYLELQTHPHSYRKAYCGATTLYSEQAVCNVLELALADELED